MPSANEPNGRDRTHFGLSEARTDGVYAPERANSAKSARASRLLLTGPAPQPDVFRRRLAAPLASSR
jgi:hypothetical protein